ncbi:MAG: M23 family metallopeptidase [Bacteroidales bacterium]|nr:M23 family metallopeptidase [Bacteroidales bacterium]
MFLRFTGLLISILIVSNKTFCQEYYLPINIYDRTELSLVQLTEIGSFGEQRKMRPGIPAHLHTGIDIKRPAQNYINESIFSIGEGIVISVRDDGPYAQIIIEHTNRNVLFWAVYEHIAGIKVEVGDLIDENTQIARFMSKSELNKYGWQFDHFHFEILKISPKKIKPKNTQPQHIFNTYNLVCYTFNELNMFYYNPLEFLEDLIR